MTSLQYRILMIMNVIRAKWRNARTAFRALGILASEEASFQMQIAAGLVTVAISYVLHIAYIEWLIILLVIGTVLAVEAMNTAVEELCDHVTPEEHPRIGKVKDLAAGATALIQIAALIIGCAIFVPRIIALL